MQTNQPLGGLLVMDLSQGVAGPYAGRLLAEHGARVIKIEPPGGDWIRGMGDGPGGVSVHFLYYGLGKESVELDLKSVEGLAAAKAIAAKADVLIESARPGVTERLGLGFEAVRALNPKITYLSVSGYGQTGPRAKEPLTDAVAQAYSGMISINTGEDGVPHKLHTTIVDALTGLYAFQTVSMALFGGVKEARHLDVTLAQAAAAAMGPKAMEFAHQGQTPALLNPPAGAYQASDGWVTITLVRDQHFRDMMTAMGRAELGKDPRFATFADRSANQALLKPIIREIIATRTVAEWVATLQAHNVLAGPVNDFGMWMADPQTIATEGAPSIAVMPGIEAAMPRTAGRAPFKAHAPAPGADTENVLAEFLPDGS